MLNVDLSGETIIVVDDEAFSRQMVADMVADMGGPKVYKAADGTAAIEMLGQLRGKGIVVSDFRMPNVNGLQLLKAVRTGEAGVERGMLFAMLTGFSDKRLVETALALDVNAFLVKPVSKVALGERLAGVLNARNDSSWLKSVSVYSDVNIGQSVRRRPDGDAKSSGPSRDKSANVLKKLSALAEKFADSDLAEAMSASTERLIDQVGEKTAAGIMSLFDALERYETLTVQDIASVLSAEAHAEEPSAAAIAEDINTVDGTLLIPAGTRASEPIASIVLQLEQIGAITLSDALRRSQAFDPKHATSRPVTADELAPGQTIARNIFTNEGLLYAASGETLTPRMVALLKDLCALNKIPASIWLRS